MSIREPSNDRERTCCNYNTCIQLVDSLCKVYGQVFFCNIEIGRYNYLIILSTLTHAKIFD